jgi:hypothetical protein
VGARPRLAQRARANASGCKLSTRGREVGARPARRATSARHALLDWPTVWRPRPSRSLACALGAALGLAAASAQAKPRAATAGPAPLTPDQGAVVAALVDETFPRARDGAPLVLCLDVQLAPEEGDDPTDGAVDDGASAVRPARHPRRRVRAKRPSKPEAPETPLVRGAPAELIATLGRPWRTVVSAATCRLDARAPIALNDARHTPARLVTVRLSPGPAPGPARVDWTDASTAPESSRDCTATRGPRGWSVRCGGTWSQ